MLGYAADVYAAGDARGQVTSSQVHKVPHPAPPVAQPANLVWGLLGLGALAFLAHQYLGRHGGRRR